MRSQAAWYENTYKVQCALKFPEFNRGMVISKILVLAITTARFYQYLTVDSHPRHPVDMAGSNLLPTIFLALIVHLTIAVVPRGIHKARVLDEPNNLHQSYDYVIIGGGTAGLTIADQLTEDEETTVLVIEYGVLSESRPRTYPICIENLIISPYQATRRISKLSGEDSTASMPTCSTQPALFRRLTSTTESSTYWPGRWLAVAPPSMP